MENEYLMGNKKFKIVKYSFLGLILLIICGCDIPGVLKVKNNLNDNLQFIVSYSEDYRKFDDTLALQPNSSKVIAYGFGTRWTDGLLNSFVNHKIDTIFLQKGKAQYYCSSVKCKKELFSQINKRSNTKLVIVIDEKLINQSFIKK